MTDEDKAFIQARFFDINPKIVARFPRYQEIADSRDSWASWETQTWRDLQVLFNLAWTDPDWLAQPPLDDLVARGRNFSEGDKATVLAVHRRLVEQVIPLHRRLQDEGRIEITFTPFYHPILPLLLDTNLAREATPDLPLPPRFTYGVDAIAQVEKGIAFYEATFGRRPAGMWPAEGAVAQEIVGIVAGAGVQWMASDEEVLARSLGQAGFSRDAREIVRTPAVLYRPYRVTSRNGEVYVIFRDKALSDKVGFTYSGMSGTAAAQDFVRRLRLIRDELRAQGAEGPFLVSVILDGENAWEHYDNDGKAFLHTMYRLLEEAQAEGVIVTTTPLRVHRPLLRPPPA
ncbi:MAG: glycoside hydrolase family 57 protein [Ardenticatenia bacterium]|nr:glycoside hydrolase family 57 protein [Ardenticatenia bacterium]